MSIPSEVRKAIKKKFPDLKFTIRKVSFSDLARAEQYFLESDEWGMTKEGSGRLFHQVKEIVDATGHDVIVSW